MTSRRRTCRPVPSMTNTGQGNPPADVTPQMTQQMIEADTNPQRCLADVGAVGSERTRLQRCGVLDRHDRQTSRRISSRDEVDEQDGQLSQRPRAQDGLAALVELLAGEPTVSVGRAERAVGDVTVGVGGAQGSVVAGCADRTRTRPTLSSRPPRESRRDADPVNHVSTGGAPERRLPPSGATGQARSTAPHCCSAAASASWRTWATSAADRVRSGARIRSAKASDVRPARPARRSRCRTGARSRAARRRRAIRARRTSSAGTSGVDDHGEVLLGHRHGREDRRRSGVRRCREQRVEVDLERDGPRGQAEVHRRPAGAARRRARSRDPPRMIARTGPGATARSQPDPTSTCTPSSSARSRTIPMASDQSAARPCAPPAGPVTVPGQDPGRMPRLVGQQRLERRPPPRRWADRPRRAAAASVEVPCPLPGRPARPRTAPPRRHPG